MMHRCTVGSCSCFHGDSITTSHHPPSPANSPSFSFLLSAPGSHNKQPIPSFNDHYDLDHSHASNYSSPVDCTLSLGTPSSRSSSGFDTERRSSVAASGSCMPNFCWDMLQPPKNDSSFVTNSNSNGSSGGNNGFGSGNDSLLARRCVNCDTTSTPLWRNGPRGPKSLCNACGIRFKKEERRAAAATTAGNSASGSLPPSTAPHTFNSHSSWIHTNSISQSHKMTPTCFIATAMGNEFLFSNDDGGADQDSEISFLSWRLNVSDRPGLVHDFTR